MVGVDRGRADDDIGAEGPQQLHLLGGDLVGHGEYAPVPPTGRHQRQADTGVARGRLHDRPTGLEQAGRLGRLDHRQRRAILDAAARVEVLELGQHVARQVATQAIESYQGRVAEQVDQRVGHVHRRAPVRDRVHLDPRVGGHRLIGVKGHRQPGPVQRLGDLECLGHRPDHADSVGNVGPQVRDGPRRHRGAIDDQVVIGAGQEAGGRRVGTDDDEHVHVPKGTRSHSTPGYGPSTPPRPSTVRAAGPLASALAVAVAVTLAAVLSGCRSAAPRPASAGRSLPTTSVGPTSSAPPPTTAASTTVPLPSPPYPVTTTSVALVDPSRPTIGHGVRIAATRALTTVVWSPVTGRGRRWPLVVFAPGYRVGPGTYAQLCQFWAARGYVVAAPSFPLADPAVAGTAVDEGDLDNEPADVRFVLASLLDPAGPAPAITAKIDPDKIGVAGHSDGAEVALAVAVAVAQPGKTVIKAAIAMAGQPVVPHQGPNPPLLVIQGDRDTINPPARSLAVYDEATPPRFLLTLLGGSHLGPFSGTSQWQAIVDAVTVDFLNQYLAGTAADDNQMAADAAHPGLSSLR